MKKNKKLICLLMAVAMSIALCLPASAANGKARTVIGADLTNDQIETVYNAFGIKRGDVKELTVTNAEEREYLEGVIASDKIGTKSISCVYIEMLDEGKGLNVSTGNINWCTEGIYRNALTTAGVSDARVIITAPFAVSGTAALTGIYKAYEDMTGTNLSEAAKEVAVEELVITGELAEAVGDVDATEVVNRLKLILDETEKMTDEELRQEILSIAEQCNVELTEKQKDSLVSLVRRLEKLDTAYLISKVEELKLTVQKVAKAGTGITGLFKKIGGFFASIANFLSGLFGKN